MFLSSQIQGGLGPRLCCPKTIVQATSKMKNRFNQGYRPRASRFEHYVQSPALFWLDLLLSRLRSPPYALLRTSSFILPCCRPHVRRPACLASPGRRLISKHQLYLLSCDADSFHIYTIVLSRKQCDGIQPPARPLVELQCNALGPTCDD